MSEKITHPTTETGTVQGRNALLTWEQARPDNFYLADSNLQNVLHRYSDASSHAEMQRTYERFGLDTATTIDEAASVEDRIGNHPRLDRFSGLGERLEQIEFHPNHDMTGRLIWGSGLLSLQSSPGHTVPQMALTYLLAHNGEAGHTCSLACTSGLIRALQQAAAADVREKFLPPLLDRDYHRMQHGAQFLTEVQGGSDVGANAVVATPASDGTWRISGEKWFCSNINADQFLMTARAQPEPGTRGLGLFLVPRRLDDGTTNGFYIRRLKDKLGTRTLASAELDFRDAVAYPVGPIERGFKTTVELVLNTSRLMNAVACAGIIRRAHIEASTYACHREAFGQPIASYPLVQEAIADLLSETYAATASSFYLAYLLDRIETGHATEQDTAVYRLLVNANKYITSIIGTSMVHRAIEVLGGNGAIESFSILPRLYRDMIVLESWEGTHNVLALQAQRDCLRYGLNDAFDAFMTAQLHISDADLQPLAEHIQAAHDQTRAMFRRMQQADPPFAQAHARRWLHMLAQIAQAALMLAEAQWERDQGLNTPKSDALTHFINLHLRPGYDPLSDEEYLPRLERLMQAS